MTDSDGTVASLHQRLEEARLASTNGTVTPNDYRRVDEAINKALRELPIRSSGDGDGPLLLSESIDPPEEKDIVPAELQEEVDELRKRHGENVEDILMEPDKLTDLAALLPGLDERELEQILIEAKEEKEAANKLDKVGVLSVTDTGYTAPTECMTAYSTDSPTLSISSFTEATGAPSVNDNAELMTQKPSADPSAHESASFTVTISSDKFLTPHALDPPTPERPAPPINLNRCTLEKRWLADEHRGEPTLYEILFSLGSSKATWLIQRRIARSVFGDVLHAYEVEVFDDYFTPLYDEEGRKRRVAIKRSSCEKIAKSQLIVAPMVDVAMLKILQKPGHPNVVKIVDVLDDGDFIYILTTPFVDGGEMFDYVSTEGPIEESAARMLFRQIMEGIAYIHSRGICHGDISLENLLIDEAKRTVYIIDFGMAHLMPVNDEGQRLMSVPGRRKPKWSYCSPEQYKQKPYDGVKTDVFSAGSVLFTMLTRTRPFASPTRTDPRFRSLVWKGQINKTVAMLGRPPLGDQAEDLLRMMMAYRPEDRPMPEQVLQHPFLTQDSV